MFFGQSDDQMPLMLGRAFGVSVPHHPTVTGVASDNEAGQVGFVSHFVLALRMVTRACMAETVRFNFRAIEGLSILEFSNKRSFASSSGVHSRPLGRGPVFILLSNILLP